MSVIDDYLAKIEPGKRAELERLRKIVKDMLPEAEEVISYRMPALKYRGQPVLGFDARRDFVGIYPFSGSVIAQIPELRRYEQTPGALHERLDDVVPAEVVRKIVEVRLAQITPGR